MSWQVVDVRKPCTYDRTFWISTDVPHDAPSCVGIGQNTDECRARTEQDMLHQGEAIIKLRQVEISMNCERAWCQFEEEENWRARYQPR